MVCCLPFRLFLGLDNLILCALWKQCFSPPIDSLRQYLTFHKERSWKPKTSSNIGLKKELWEIMKIPSATFLQGGRKMGKKQLLSGKRKSSRISCCSGQHYTYVLCPVRERERAGKMSLCFQIGGGSKAWSIRTGIQIWIHKLRSSLQWIAHEVPGVKRILSFWQFLELLASVTHVDVLKNL